MGMRVGLRWGGGRWSPVTLCHAHPPNTPPPQTKVRSQRQSKYSPAIASAAARNPVYLWTFAHQAYVVGKKYDAVCERSLRANSKGCLQVCSSLHEQVLCSCLSPTLTKTFGLHGNACLHARHAKLCPVCKIYISRKLIVNSHSTVRRW